MQFYGPEAQTWIAAHESLIIPLLIAAWISWSDLRTRKIPNYLTLGAALAGLLYNLAVFGLSGLTSGILGLLMGFGFLILPYILGGMGAGDVKALAALGAWLGPLPPDCDGSPQRRKDFVLTRPAWTAGLVAVPQWSFRLIQRHVKVPPKFAE